jgi:heme/copper-type cytochrome/quinol oxidase subunit 3
MDIKETSGQSENRKDVFADFSPEVRVRTKKMLMAFIIFAIVMLFAGFTSAYIISNIGSYWVHIKAPAALWWSVVVIAISSITLYLSLRFMKQSKVLMSQVMLAATLALGIVFTLTQQSGWRELTSKGMGYTIDTTEDGLKAYRWNNLEQISAEYGVDYYIYRDGNKLIESKGQYYAEEDVLLAEPLTTKVLQTTNSASSYILVLILIHILHLVFGLIYLTVNLIRSFTGVINPNDTVRLYTTGMYWHFLGILWVYLFFFLFIFH